MSKKSYISAFWGSEQTDTTKGQSMNGPTQSPNNGSGKRSKYERPPIAFLQKKIFCKEKYFVHARKMVSPLSIRYPFNWNNVQSQNASMTQPMTSWMNFGTPGCAKRPPSKLFMTRLLKSTLLASIGPNSTDRMIPMNETTLSHPRLLEYPMGWTVSDFVNPFK